MNIVLDKVEGAPNLALAEDATISITCHAKSALLALARAFDGAVAMTSANLSGTSDGVLVDIDTAVRHIGGSVKLALSGGPVATTKSTMIVRVDDGLSLLREGDLTFDRIQPDILALQ